MSIWLKYIPKINVYWYVTPCGGLNVTLTCHALTFLGLLEPEYRGTKILRNIGKDPYETASHPI